MDLENEIIFPVEHADMAIKVAHAAQRDFNTMKVEQKVQDDFTEGVKLLEDAVIYGNKGNSQLVEKNLIRALTLWHPVEGPVGCHGDGCPLLANGCCATPGMLKCNRYFPARKCTNVGNPCVCYCM